MENFPARPPTDQATVNALLAQLAHEDSTRRHEARAKLGAMGSPAVPGLIECLYDPREHVRWEAAKTLEIIADPLTASALVTALEDENKDVRWVAGEALVALKDAAIAPLLYAVMRRASSHWLAKSAHHVLHELAKKRRLHDLLAPVLTELESLEPGVSAPPAALTALEQWRNSIASRDQGKGA
jgi:HEAT repeat protein